MSDFDKDKVLGRVRKMMALANDAAASEGERENALRMAHATLAKYNLTIGEAEAAGKVTDEPRESNLFEGRDYPWMRTTAAAVARLFFCRYFYVSIRGGKVRHYFVGKQSNVVTAIGMARYLIESISREAKRTTGDRSNGTMWRSFGKGAAHRIYQRCYEIQAAAESAPATPGTALVLASVYRSEEAANDEYIREQMKRNIRTVKTTQRNTAASAFYAGSEYGGRVGLNNQIGSTAKGGSDKLLK